jgi:hypothetical protein
VRTAINTSHSRHSPQSQTPHAKPHESRLTTAARRCDLAPRTGDRAARAGRRKAATQIQMAKICGGGESSRRVTTCIWWCGGASQIRLQIADTRHKLIHDTDYSLVVSAFTCGHDVDLVPERESTCPERRGLREMCSRVTRRVVYAGLRWGYGGRVPVCNVGRFEFGTTCTSARRPLEAPTVPPNSWFQASNARG